MDSQTLFDWHQSWVGGLWVIVVLVHGRRCAGHFSHRGELSVIVVIVKGRRCAEHFSPRGELSVIIIIVKGRRRAEHFSPRGELSVIVIIVNGWRCAGHFSPRGELSVIVVLINAEPDGPNHLVMMFQNRSQMPTPLLGCLIAVRLRLVAREPLPLDHPTKDGLVLQGGQCKWVTCVAQIWNWYLKFPLWM